MSNTGFNPVVVAPRKFKVKTESGAYQKPFFFGGAQTPINLGLAPSSFSGSGIKQSSGCGIRGKVFHKGTPSLNRPSYLPFA
jgi:hypothetical protein